MRNLAILLTAVSLTGCVLRGHSIDSNEPVWSKPTAQKGQVTAAGSVNDGRMPPATRKEQVIGTADGRLPPAAERKEQVIGTAAENDGRMPPATEGFGPVPAAATYKIGPADVLDISVLKVPELTKTVKVAVTGTINLPLLGEILAAGKTPQQLEGELTAKLGATYLQHPQVTVKALRIAGTAKGAAGADH